MTTPRAKTLILGALVADAAAMGTHWIYDQDRLHSIAPETPEFTGPDPAHYKDVPAYFAHGTRAAGQTSQYGEQVLVMLDALAANDGQYNAGIYSNQFRQHFGYGGAWGGYIDHATRETLNNFLRVEDDARALAQNLPFAGDRRVTSGLVSKASALIAQTPADELRKKYEEAVHLAHDDPAIRSHATAILDTLLTMPPRFGAVDEQMPATAKLPGLVAALHDAEDALFWPAIDSAVRFSSDHPNAHDLGRVCAAMMRAALKHDDIPTIVDAGQSAGSAHARALIEDARNRLQEDTNSVTKHFGMACDLTQGVPSVVHNILTAKSFAEAVRRNIWAGGDTCGRAILVGSILGAVYGIGGTHGIPEDWIDKMQIDKNTLDALR